eukprot:6394022-Alexandrium_andersonii.AAC.1
MRGFRVVVPTVAGAVWASTQRAPPSLLAGCGMCTSDCRTMSPSTCSTRTVSYTHLTLPTICSV